MEHADLAGLLILTPRRFGDVPGFFFQNRNRKTLHEAGVDLSVFVPDNHSLSHQTGTVRGLHCPSPPRAQGKLMRCGRLLANNDYGRYLRRRAAKAGQ